MDLLEDAAAALAKAFPHVAGALGPHGQRDRLLRLHTPLGPDVLLPERARIDETVGPAGDATAPAGLKLQIDALATDAHLELKRLTGQPLLLELLTQASRTDLRPWHGHVTAVQLLGSDGGFARYRLVVEPWLAFLGHRRDSWVFQGTSVMEIVEQVFGDYEAQAQLAPAWRWDLADPAAYPQRSLCIQYQETDLAFVQRLLREEGLFCWWEHTGDATSPALGAHTLVIADHNGALRPNAQARVRYTQADAALPEDSLVRWQRRRRVHTAGLTLASRDYRTTSQRDQGRDGVDAPIPELGLHDVPGQYAYEDSAQGARLARVQIEAIDAMREQVRARGSWRSAAPATRFTLTEHPVHDGSDASRDEYVVTAVTHEARNNLAADPKAGRGTLDASAVHGAVDAHAVHGAVDAPVRDITRHHAAPANAGDEPVYQCTLTVLPARLPLRIAALDEQGLPDPRLHARPLVTGVQTALVVGLAEPVHTDRDHRLKVQFHWQRGGRASHRLHAPSGADDAPASDASGTWVRVAESVAGANWGANFMPRLGQEVVVEFTNGDPDRPVVIGVVYNGVGAVDAQGNQVPAGAAGAVGSAPAWFPGERAEGPLQAHRHAQVHTGYKSQELATSQSGFGGHNQLVFDDSPGEGRIELFSSSAQTRLQLGHLRHQIDNRRQQPRGHGADLATAAWGAVRAGAGALLSAHRRPNSEQATKPIDAREPIAQLDQGQQLIHTLAESAQQHNAKAAQEPNILGAKRPDKAKQLPIEQGLYATLDSLETTATRGSVEGDEETIGGGHGTVPAWGRPDLVLAAPAGIGSFTPASTLLTAAANASFVAGQDLQQIAQANHATAVKGAAILYTHGRAQDPDKPNQETGIAMHAASGNVQTQSQTGATKFTADRKIHVVSTTTKVSIAAPKHVLLWAAGAAIRMENGAISLTGPGSVLFKASQKIFNSPGANVPHGFRRLPVPQDVDVKPVDLALHYLHSDDEPVQGAPYEVEFADGSKRKGVLDASGKAFLMDVPPGAAKVHYGDDARKGPVGEDEPNPLFGWMD